MPETKENWLRRGVETKKSPKRSPFEGKSSPEVEAVQAMLPSGVMLTFPDGGLLRTTVKTATDSWVSDLCHLHLLGMPQILGARGASVQSIAVESGVPPPPSLPTQVAENCGGNSDLDKFDIQIPLLLSPSFFYVFTYPNPSIC